jgi:hypothetical protein
MLWCQLARVFAVVFSARVFCMPDMSGAGSSSYWHHSVIGALQVTPIDDVVIYAIMVNRSHNGGFA